MSRQDSRTRTLAQRDRAHHTLTQIARLHAPHRIGGGPEICQVDGRIHPCPTRRLALAAVTPEVVTAR